MTWDEPNIPFKEGVMCESHATAQGSRRQTVVGASALSVPDFWMACLAPARAQKSLSGKKEGEKREKCVWYFF